MSSWGDGQVAISSYGADLVGSGADYGHVRVFAYTIPPTPAPTPAPTPSPTPAPTPAPTPPPCFDKLMPSTNGSWYDAYGPMYTCEWYALGDRCTKDGSKYAMEGMTANQVCCVCNGGQVENATLSPCLDTKFGDGTSFSDADGTTCQDYQVYDGYCEKYGMYGMNQGLTANMACCQACNGGTWYAPLPQCYDLVTPLTGRIWVDTWNRNCEWYVRQGSCWDFSLDYLANEGLTAREACCGCRGGSLDIPVCPMGMYLDMTKTICCDDTFESFNPDELGTCGTKCMPGFEYVDGLCRP